MRSPDGIDLTLLSAAEMLLKRKSLRRRLAERQDLQPVRIAVLGGSTTNELVDLLELRLLDAGFRPAFHQSEYGRFYDDAVHDSEALIAFRPDIVYLHTSVLNLQGFASVNASEGKLHDGIRDELNRFEQIWSALESKLRAIVIQNTFELPPLSVLGNVDVSSPGGRTRFVNELNHALTRAARGRARLLLQDVASISARMGLDAWFDSRRWFASKIVTSPEGSDALAQSLCAMVRAIYGRMRKVLVLDLDNTLWGGVIGDDGLEGIRIGRETPLAEAYTAFQEYCLALRERGVLLAVCSKNDPENARLGFAHPDSVLRLEHISSFQANWEPKHENIAAIARELNLGTDSFVFVDDNPAERALVAAQVPGIAVPDVGSDPALFPAILQAGRYFEPLSLSVEDLARADSYRQNAERTSFAQSFADYGAYLDSLEMVAEIAPFSPVYVARIAQLTNKTNQFNLTTRRCTVPEIEAVLADPNALGLYGRLRDRFGDNGLVCVVLGRREGDMLDIELLLMSCRVLKREMEFAMLDAVVAHARQMAVEKLRGRYIPSSRNQMVRGLYSALGFTLVSESQDGSATYILALADHTPRTRHIRVVEPAAVVPPRR